MHIPARSVCCFSLVLLAAQIPAWGQSVTSTPPADAGSKAIAMDPFAVSSDSDSSYAALNSNSLTRFKAELDKLPMSADIFDQAFMSDIAATSVEAMIQSYSAGAGNASLDQTTGAGSQPGDHVSHQFTQLRGLATTSIERDGLMPLGLFYNPGATIPGTTSNFDIERVEIINGPQALLYSGGGAGGVISTVSKQARFDAPVSGSGSYRVDNYGGKIGEFDFGVGTDRVAIRLAITDQSDQSRRINIGTKMDGQYLQVAVRPFKNTVVRIVGEQTTANHIDPTSLSLAAGSSTADSRQSDSLQYLLAANLTGAGASSPNSQGNILNGLLNWSNVNSLQGWGNSEKAVSTYGAITVETEWSHWLSTQFAAGYNDYRYDLVSTQSTSLYTPGDAANPTGGWAVATTPIDTEEPARNKAIRFSALATNDFFGGAAHSQTIVGADYVRSDAFSIVYDYFQADANFNPIINPALTTKNGRTQTGATFWSINNGPLLYPYFSPPTPQVVLNGVNYVRGISQIVNPALISPSNPLGVTSTGTYEFLKRFDQGIYGVNYTQWFDGKLTTLAGIRVARVLGVTQEPGDPYNFARATTPNIDFGVDYKVLSWLRAYADVSSSYSPPLVLFTDPSGNLPQTSRGVGGETGFKISSPNQAISGSVSYYYTRATNQEYQIPSALQTDINPAGLNGTAGATSSTYVDLNEVSQGIQATITANPLPNWRLRFSASNPSGTILSTKSYGQLYNDQFHTDGAGDVTYADGTKVYVNPTYNAKAPFATATTPGAVPLTLAMMNNPSSPYYASPVNPSGAILSSSVVASILKGVVGTLADPSAATHGSILTGAVGLPISALQITPPFTVPGSIPIAQAGDHTVGYPSISSNLTSVYTFTSSWLKGFEIGGTATGNWKYNEFYYYPAGLGASFQRSLYTAPTSFTFDLIAGYSHRFRFVTWSTQLNIFNLFNHYDVLILPNQSTGWTVASGLRANFFGEPRSAVWSNTVKF